MALGLAGCNEDRYLSRSDKIVSSSGDAVNSNKAVHTIKPWNDHVSNDDIKVDSNRGLIAVDRYQTDNVKKPGGETDKKTQVDITLKK